MVPDFTVPFELPDHSGLALRATAADGRPVPCVVTAAFLRSLAGPDLPDGELRAAFNRHRPAVVARLTDVVASAHPNDAGEAVV